MKVWLKAGVIIFYVLGYCFLRKRMRRDIVKLFKAYMLLMIFLLSLLPEPFILKHLGVTLRADTLVLWMAGIEAVDASDEPDNKTGLPEGYEEGMILVSVKAEKSTHYTSPPKMFTEDTLLAAMETEGNKEFDSETEKKGLGTPATRANIIEKLVSSGYAERKGKQILPTAAGCELIHVMPENLKSASLTAEWENQLLMMEKGKIRDDEFMDGIVSMITEILSVCRAIPEEERSRFQTAREVIGKCPICGSDVYEGKSNYYCSDRSCPFALWKSNRFLESMKKSMDKKMAVELLKRGRTHVKGLYSKKKDSKFDADLVLGVEDGKARFSLEFPKKKTNSNKKKK